MAVTPRIEIRQSQSLLMTPQLRQAINLLQMNNLELRELVEKELESNPLLEREDDCLAATEDKIPTIDTLNTAESEPIEEDSFTADIDGENAFDDYGSDREGYEPSWTNKIGSKTTNADDDFDYIAQRAAATESVYELLNRQIEGHFSLPDDRLIASHLISFLDHAGYFTGNLPEISEQLQIDISKLQQILSVMKTFEPSGIFAASLKECLSIQLKDQNRLDTMMQTFLEHLDLLADGNLKTLKKLCQADDEDIASMIADIKALNPKPLTAYNFDDGGYIVPDVFVRQRKNGDYLVELNQDTLPRVLLNREYISCLSGKAVGKNDKKYLKERLNSAGFLIKALHQRATTILRVSEEIVSRQRDFFEHGISHIRPLLLRDIAEAVEMHESTISRVTAHKYMQTPRGTFELKYFFSAAAGTYNGDTQTSATSIKHLLKQLIDNEGDKILSDDALVELMAAHSIKIARRTIAKYREEMGIPTSAQRKRNLRRFQMPK